jgi:hypothetical protein
VEATGERRVSRGYRVAIAASIAIGLLKGRGTRFFAQISTNGQRKF